VALGLLGADNDPVMLTKNAQVVLSRRAADTELDRNDLFDIANLVFAAREDLDDATPDGLAHDFEGMHVFFMSVRENVRAN